MAVSSSSDSAVLRWLLNTEQMTALWQIADEFNVAVVITNQVMSDPSGGAMFVTDPKKAVGGHVRKSASDHVLQETVKCNHS